MNTDSLSASYSSEEQSSITSEPSAPKRKFAEEDRDSAIKNVRKEVQENAEKSFDSLPIRKLDLSRVKKVVSEDHWKHICALNEFERGHEIIKRIIQIYNRSNEEGKIPFEELDYDYEIYKKKWKPSPFFHLITYFRQVYIEVSKIASFHLGIGAKLDLSKKSTEYISFFFRTVKGLADENSDIEMFALSTGDAWHPLEKFTDWNFSKQIAKRYMQPQVHYIEFTPLVGNKVSEKKPFKTPETLPRTKYYNKLVTKVDSGVRHASSLFSLEAFQNKKGQALDLKMSVRMGCIRFGKQLSMKDYPPLLNLLSRISRNLPTYLVKLDPSQKIVGRSHHVEFDDHNLKHWDDISFVPFDKFTALEEALKSEIWRSFCEGGECPLDFYHKRTTDYYRSTEFVLKIKGQRKPLAKWHRPYSAAEMIALAKEKYPSLGRCKNQKVFFQTLNQLQVSFRTPSKTQPALFSACFSGEVRLASEGSFFKIGGKWYCVSTDLVSWVEDEFRQLIQQRLITKKEKGFLPHIWPDKKQVEAAYNRTYEEVEGFLVCDSICPRGIELCDLLYYDKEAEVFYFYHVKEGFGQKTRDACSQIRNAADQLIAALSPQAKESILDEFVEMVESRKGEFNFCGSKEAFKSLIKKKKIIFVYAFADSAKKERMIQRETKLKARFEKDDFKDILEAEGIWESIIENEFLNEDGSLTSKFLCSTKEDFVSSLQKNDWSNEIIVQIYETLLHGVSHFKSTIARLELLNLQKSFNDRKNIEFKICQIARNKQSNEQDEEYEHDVLFLPKLQEIDLVQVFEGETFSLYGETYVIDKTLGDGTCALHALLGSSQEGVFKILLGPKAAREDLIKKLKEALRENNVAVIALFRSHLKSIYKEFLAHPNDEWLSKGQVNDIVVELIERKEKVESEIEKLNKQRFEAFKTFYSSDEYEPDEEMPLKIAANPLEYFASFPNEFTLYCNQLMMAIPETKATNIRTIDALIEECHARTLALEDEFVDNPRVRRAYFEELLDEDYWFESNEIGLAAFLYQKHVVICHVENRVITKANEYNPTAAEKMVLFQEQNGNVAHFSHCTKSQIPLSPPEQQEELPTTPPKKKLRKGNGELVTPVSEEKRKSKDDVVILEEDEPLPTPLKRLRRLQKTQTSSPPPISDQESEEKSYNSMDEFIVPDSDE